MVAIAWTKNCKSVEEKENRIQSLKRIAWAFDELKGFLQDSVNSIEGQEISPKSYDSPNWASRQAHANGYKQAVRDFNKLLTLDPKEENGRQPTE
jgi:hypothetical protein